MTPGALSWELRSALLVSASMPSLPTAAAPAALALPMVQPQPAFDAAGAMARQQAPPQPAARPANALNAKLSLELELTPCEDDDDDDNDNNDDDVVVVDDDESDEASDSDVFYGESSASWLEPDDARATTGATGGAGDEPDDADRRVAKSKKPCMRPVGRECPIRAVMPHHAAPDALAAALLAPSS